MTPEAVLLALIAALILAGLLLFYRLTNSDGSVSWRVTTTIPDDPWAIKFTAADRDEAMRKHAQTSLQSDMPGPGENE